MPEPITKLQRRIDRIGYGLGHHVPMAAEELMEEMRGSGLNSGAFSGATVLFVGRPVGAELTDRLRRLSGALSPASACASAITPSYRGVRTNRDVAGYGLLFQYGQWYLIGHDTTRDAVRVCRVGRLEDVAPNTRRPDTPDHEDANDFGLDDYAGRRASNFSPLLRWILSQEGDAVILARSSSSPSSSSSRATRSRSNEREGAG